jgi:hypothetical protein
VIPVEDTNSECPGSVDCGANALMERESELGSTLVTGDLPEGDEGVVVFLSNALEDYRH